MISFDQFRSCLILGAALLAGCSGPEIVATKGKLIQNGQPAKVDIDTAGLPPGVGVGRMTVDFYAVNSAADRLDGTNRLHSAIVEGDGSFSVPGDEGDGIPPGKYRVVVKHIDPRTEKDLLGGKFNEANSKITQDVNADSGEIVIDLGEQ